MKIKIKRIHPSAVIPSYARVGDAGMDLTAISVRTDEYGNYVYGTGLIFEIPEGFEGQIRPRSSIKKYDLFLRNTPGTIDSGYRGEVFIVFGKTGLNPQIYTVGSRVAQIVIKTVPYIQFEEVNELSETERGEGGFGSTEN